MLTNEKMYAGKAEAANRPTIVRLITIGTPNHGSTLARLRIVIEARDQLVRALSGDGLLFGSVFDGAGEAQVDLLPDSEFLQQLNKRPLPKDVLLTVIAGKASPVTSARIDATGKLVSSHLPNGQSDHVDDIAKMLKDVANDVGDGVVSLESSKLEGVEDYIVLDRNHITLLKNITSWQKDPAPALPVIFERLESDKDAGRHGKR